MISSLLVFNQRPSVKAQTLPDLAITDVYWEPQNPITKVTIYCVFENIGKADVTQQFTIRMYLDGNWKTDYYWFSWSFSPSDLPIKPGDVWTWNTGELSITHRTHKIEWEVDSLKQVPDADHSNNRMEKTLYWSTSSITTSTTIIATRTSVSFTTTATSITEATMFASIAYVDYPKHVNMGETFKVPVDVNYVLPQPGVLAVFVDDMATGHHIAQQWSGNTRYGGVAHFVLWITAPNQNVIWNLDIVLCLGITIGGVNSVEHQEISMAVGSATATSVTTSHVSTTSAWTSTTETATASTTASSTQGRCMIATAAYGSELSPVVQALRTFRENIVLSTFAGTQFMKAFNAWYYSFSPMIASYVASAPSIRIIVKALIYPLITILQLSTYIYLVLGFNRELGVFVAGVVASSLIGLVYDTPWITAILLYAKKKKGFVLHLRSLRLFAYIWLATIILIGTAEVLLSPHLMTFATASFILLTLGLSATISASFLARKLR